MTICKPCADRTGQTWKKHASNKPCKLCRLRFQDVMLVEDKKPVEELGEQLTLEVD